jgi:hypothetical protein
MDDFATRREVLSWERSTTVWTVHLGFGGRGSTGRCVKFCFVSLASWVLNLTGLVQILVASLYGRHRVLGGNGGPDRSHRNNAGARELRVLGPSRLDHTRYQGQCVRICACATQPLTHPFLASYPPRCLSRLSISCVLSRPIGLTLACGLSRMGGRSSWAPTLNSFTASVTLSEVFSAANQMGSALAVPVW